MPFSVIVTCIAGEWEGTIDLGRRDSYDPQLVLVISRRRAVAPVDNTWRVAAHVSIGAVAGRLGRRRSSFTFCVPRRLHPEAHIADSSAAGWSTTGKGFVAQIIRIWCRSGSGR